MRGGYIGERYRSKIVRLRLESVPGKPDLVSFAAEGGSVGRDEAAILASWQTQPVWQSEGWKRRAERLGQPGYLNRDWFDILWPIPFRDWEEESNHGPGNYGSIGRQALHALLNLDAAARPKRAAAFVKRYGELFDWDNYRDPGAVDVDRHGLLRGWLLRNGELAAATYVDFVYRRITEPGGLPDESMMPTPVLMFSWAADQLSALIEIKERGESLTDELGLRMFAEGSLAATRLAFAGHYGDGTGDALVIHAEDVLAYLVSQALLGLGATEPRALRCEGCGKELIATRADKRFCTPKCQHRHKMRRLRERGPARTREETVDG